MLGFMGMDSDAILGVSPLHGLFVLPQSDLQCPFGLAYVSFVTTFAGDFINNASLPFIWNPSLDLHQGLFQDLHWLEGCFDSQRGTNSLNLLTEAFHIGQA